MDRDMGDFESLYSQAVRRVARDPLKVLCEEQPGGGYRLRAGLLIPRVVCEQLVEACQRAGGDVFEWFAYVFADVSRTTLRSVHVRRSDVTDNGLLCLLRHGLCRLELSYCSNLTRATYTNIHRHSENMRSLSIGHGVHIVSVGLPSVDILLDLRRFDGLHTLGLRGVPVALLQTENAIAEICHLRSLTVLDLSQKHLSEHISSYDYPNEVLSRIMESLPNLTHLDISGTNLAGIDVVEVEFSSGKISDIPGLQCRVENHLDFLGLYGTRHNACKRRNIPARTISGSANDDQLFHAAVSRMDDMDALSYVLADLLSLVREGRCTQYTRAYDLTLEAVNRFVNKDIMQIVGCSILHAIIQKSNAHSMPRRFDKYLLPPNRQ